jgi:hypothetical protein
MPRAARARTSNAETAGRRTPDNGQLQVAPASGLLRQANISPWPACASCSLYAQATAAPAPFVPPDRRDTGPRMGIPGPSALSQPLGEKRPRLICLPGGCGNLTASVLLPINARPTPPKDNGLRAVSYCHFDRGSADHQRTPSGGVTLPPHEEPTRAHPALCSRPGAFNARKSSRERRLTSSDCDDQFTLRPIAP